GNIACLALLRKERKTGTRIREGGEGRKVRVHDYTAWLSLGHAYSQSDKYLPLLDELCMRHVKGIAKKISRNEHFLILIILLVIHLLTCCHFLLCTGREGRGRYMH